MVEVASLDSLVCTSLSLPLQLARFVYPSPDNTLQRGQQPSESISAYSFAAWGDEATPIGKTARAQGQAAQAKICNSPGKQLTKDMGEWNLGCVTVDSVTLKLPIHVHDNDATSASQHNTVGNNWLIRQSNLVMFRGRHGLGDRSTVAPIS